MKQVVSFLINGKEFGLDMTKTKTIDNPKELIKRDDLPDFVQGIMNIHGDMIPIVDVAQRMQLPEYDEVDEIERRVLVFLNRAGNYGIPVDAVTEIFKVEDADVQRIPGFFSGSETDYTECIVKKGNSLVLVLDPDKFLLPNQWEEMLKLMETIEKERIEEEKRKREELRRKKEEEKRKREEEMRAMAEAQENAGQAEKPEIVEEGEISEDD
ncbi:MAG: chemotaxis protein CheW [Eubacterium sp.]|nr:chemotaxis protein CheW [Eubacterium sp.]